MGYACLVAIMCTGKGYHCQSERRLHDVTIREGAPTPVVTSAGALVEGLKTLNARKIAMVAPYLKPLTQIVTEYIEAEGIEVVDAIALEIPDNVEVGRRDPMALVEIHRRLKLDGADAVVLSSCVQMPSLAAIPVRGAGMWAASRVRRDLYDTPDVERSSASRQKSPVRVACFRGSTDVLRAAPLLGTCPVLVPEGCDDQPASATDHGPSSWRAWSRPCRRSRRWTFQASGASACMKTGRSVSPVPSWAIFSVSRSTMRHGFVRRRGTHRSRPCVSGSAARIPPITCGGGRRH